MSDAALRVTYATLAAGQSDDFRRTGKSSGGLYYVQQFLREQSRTLAH